MDSQTLKLECLKLAAEKQPRPDHKAAVEMADAYWRWLTSSSDQSPEPPESIAHRS